MAQNLLADAGATGDMHFYLDWEDPLEKEIATHSSILARIIPWKEVRRATVPDCERVGHY